MNLHGLETLLLGLGALSIGLTAHGGLLLYRAFSRVPTTANARAGGRLP